MSIGLPSSSAYASGNARWGDEATRLLFESNPQPMWVYDVKTLAFLAVNEAALRQYGYERDEFLRLTIKHIRPTEEVPAVLRAIAETGSGAAWAGAWRHQRKNGTVFDVEVASQPIIWDERPARLVLATDVSSRKRVEERLYDREEKYRAILDTMEEAYYEVDLKGSFTFFNDQLCRMLGYTRGVLLGMNHRQYTDPATVRQLYEAFNRVFTTGLPTQAHDWEVIRHDGSRRSVEASISLMRDAEGRSVGFRGIVRDITGRKRGEAALRQSEAHYRSLVQNAPYGIFRVTEEGRFLAVNPALVAMLGYASGDELLATPIGDVYRDPGGFERLVAGYHATGRVQTVDAQWKRRDGRAVAIRLSGRAAVEEDGTVTGFEMIVDDVTDRRHLEEQLRQAQKMEAVGRLAGGVAHDFGNLITAILGYSRLLSRDMPDDDARRSDVEEIRLTAERAGALTRQLLAYSRRQILAPRLLDLNQVVADMAGMLRRLIGEDIELATVPDADLGCVRADPSQIGQVLVNLVVNARDAMPTGGRLTIETANADLDADFARRHTGVQAGEHILLAVSDTGTGMDAATRAHLFEPFFTTKPPGQGTGLGLATVYGIVKQSGGSIWVYSELSQGTTFKIYLPRVRDSAVAPHPQLAPAARGHETLLLVEDEPGVRTTARASLVDHGYTVLEAASGEEALALLDRVGTSPIHLLVTDVVMPLMKGQELAQRFRLHRPGTPVLFTSGYTDSALGAAGVLPPGVAFLQKPFSPEALARKVREVLDQR